MTYQEKTKKDEQMIKEKYDQKRKEFKEKVNQNLTLKYSINAWTIISTFQICD